jgi:hypothetical protein
VLVFGFLAPNPLPCIAFVNEGTHYHHYLTLTAPLPPLHCPPSPLDAAYPKPSWCARVRVCRPQHSLLHTCEQSHPPPAPHYHPSSHPITVRHGTPKTKPACLVLSLLALNPLLGHLLSNSHLNQHHHLIHNTPQYPSITSGPHLLSLVCAKPTTLARFRDFGQKPQNPSYYIFFSCQLGSVLICSDLLFRPVL